MADILDQLEINQTLYFQLGLFVVFFVALKFVYVKPFQRLILRRQKVLAQVSPVGGGRLDQIQAEIAEVEAAIAKMSRKAQAVADQDLLQARKESESQIAMAKESLKKEAQSHLAKIQADSAKEQNELRANVAVLADQLAERLIQVGAK